MITLGPEPEGFLIRREDVLSWLPGLTRKQWKKIRPTLTERFVPGGLKPSYTGQRPHYAKEEVRAKLITPHR